MNHVIENIEYLVHRHDCVVLPTWGAFIAQYRPSHYDEVHCILMPPSRELSFNPNVDHNDGLLASSVARRLNIPFNQAASIVERDVEAMKHQLEADGELPLGMLGRFVHQRNSSLLFEPDARIESYATAGFSPIEISPVMEQARRDAGVEEPMAPKRRLPRMIRKVGRVAAMIALVAVAAGVVSIPTLLDRDDNLAAVGPTVAGLTGSSQTSSAMPMASTVSGTAITPAESQVEATAETASASVTTSETVGGVNIPKATVKAVKEQTPTPVAEPEAQSQPATPNRYCLVVASLPSQSQAEKFIRESGDSSLQIIAMDGRFRVYAAASPTSEGAAAAKTGDIAKRYPDAWVCRMK